MPAAFVPLVKREQEGRKIHALFQANIVRGSTHYWAGCELRLFRYGGLAIRPTRTSTSRLAWKNSVGARRIAMPIRRTLENPYYDALASAYAVADCTSMPARAKSDIRRRNFRCSVRGFGMAEPFSSYST